MRGVSDERCGGVGAEGVGGTALARGMGCLGRSTLVGGVSGTAAGGFDGAAGYLTGPGPHTVGGFLGATGGGAVFGGFTGAGVGALSSVTDVSRFGCFPAGTRVLMADGTAKPIEDVEAGDRVASVDPDTGRPATATVTATFTHRDVDTIRVSTDRGELVATAAHPLYARGRAPRSGRCGAWARPPPVRPGQGDRGGMALVTNWPTPCTPGAGASSPPGTCGPAMFCATPTGPPPA